MENSFQSKQEDADEGDFTEQNYSISDHPNCLLKNYLEGNIDKSNTVNLDTTCMIAYCSHLSNGGTDCKYENEVVQQQCEWEKKKPSLPQIKAYMKGKRIIACEEAVDRFTEILEVVGGPNEKRRGAELIEKIEVVEGIDLFKDYLENVGRVKPLPCIVFGTGFFYGVPTITSNQGFINSCLAQKLVFETLMHEPRCLSEVKAIPTSDSFSNKHT